MKKINIAVIGPIGVGKTTFIKRLKEVLEKASFKVLVVNEPSVSILPVNQLLERLYENIKKWAYPLQASISASHEAEFESIKDEDYDFSIFDMPYSSYMYCHIHQKNKRMTKKEMNNIINISRKFDFDFLISLSGDEEAIIKRVKNRNNSSSPKTAEKADNLTINDFSYLHEHLKDFQKFKKGWKKKFFKDSKNVEIVLEDKNTERYNKQLDSVAEIIKKYRLEVVTKMFLEGKL